MSGRARAGTSAAHGSTRGGAGEGSGRTRGDGYRVDPVLEDVSFALHAGEFADFTNPVAVIAEIRPLLVEVYLPVEAYPLIATGMRAQVKPQEPIGGSYEAEVITKDPQIDSASGMFQVTLKLPNEKQQVPAGLRCAIQFLD